MKTPKSRRRTLASLALAGTLGLTGPLAAQVSPYQAAKPAGTAAAQAPTEAQTRVEAIQIELAWLADPVTCPYNLGIYPSGAAFEVRGFVPTEAVRSQALKVARGLTRRMVTDGIRIYPGMAIPTANEAPEAMQKAATETLIQAMGDRGRTLVVRAKPGGQLTVTGTAGCYEEKLVISRLLRRVRGCSAVVNELTVVTVLRDGKLYHLVSADGLQRVPAHPEILHVNHTPAAPASPPAASAPPPLRGLTPPAQLPPCPAPAAPTAGSSEVKSAAPKPANDSWKPAKPSATAAATPPATKPPAPLARTSFETAQEVKPAPALARPVPAAKPPAAPVPSVPATNPATKPAPAPPAAPTNGPRIVMVKMLETLPGSPVPVERMAPVLLSGSDRLQATRALSDQEFAALRAQGVPVVNSPARPALPALGKPPAAPLTRTPTPPPLVARTETPPANPPRKPDPPAEPADRAEPLPAGQVNPKPVENAAGKPLEIISTRPAQSAPTKPALTPGDLPVIEAASSAAPPAPATSLPAIVTLPKEEAPAAPLPVIQSVPPAPRKETPPVSEPSPPAPVASPTLPPNTGASTPPTAKPEARPVAVLSAKKPAPAIPAAPYVTTGEVTIEEEPPPAPPPPTDRRIPPQLRSRIEAVCEGKARGVEITARSEKELRILLQIASAADAPRLSAKVLNLPELGPYDVDLDVQITP
jgi:hypothetical protein